MCFEFTADNFSDWAVSQETRTAVPEAAYDICFSNGYYRSLSRDTCLNVVLGRQQSPLIPLGQQLNRPWVRLLARLTMNDKKLLIIGPESRVHIERKSYGNSIVINTGA